MSQPSTRSSSRYGSRPGPGFAKRTAARRSLGRAARCTFFSPLPVAHNKCAAAQIDNETLDMLKTLNMANLPGIKVQQVYIQPLPLFVPAFPSGGLPIE